MQVHSISKDLSCSVFLSWKRTGPGLVGREGTEGKTKCQYSQAGGSEGRMLDKQWHLTVSEARSKTLTASQTPRAFPSSPACVWEPVHSTGI